MQEQNVFSVEYFKDKARFADLINGYVLEGNIKISEEDIEEMDSVILGHGKQGTAIWTKTNIHDLMRKITVQTQVVLIALEEQTEIHYAMPVRVMNTLAAHYDGQWKRIRKKHKENKDLKSGAEYLSGFSKEDSLIPVINIVLYFGQKPWDGPLTLKDMLKLSEYPVGLQKMIVVCQIHLLEVRRYEYLERFQTDLRYVFGFLQKMEDKKQLITYINQNKEIFMNLQDDAYDLLEVMSHTKELRNIKQKEKNTGGGYSMKNAIYELIEDGRQDGISIGEKRINMLNQRLVEENRTDDLLRSVKDNRFQRKLLKEYALY